MRANALRAAWNAGNHTINAWCSIPSSFSAEVMAHQGFDSVTVDMQHGVIDYQAMVGMLQAISTTATTPMVRVPWREPGIIMKSLDAGAYGIICPMVNNREQAQELVAYASYPPRGTRSFGPIRALIYGGADYPQHANDEVLTIAMIETAEAMDNLDAIMSVEGLDGIYVGPADLSNALGCTPKFDQEEKPVVDAINEIIACAKRNNIFAGIHCGSTAYAKQMHTLGFNFITLLSEARMMAAQAKKMADEMRDQTPAAQASGTY